MSDLVKFEYIKVLNEFEEISKKFEELQNKTDKLKMLYSKNPTDEVLLQQIRNHEAEYKQVYEKYVELNQKVKVLKAKSDIEVDEQ